MLRYRSRGALALSVLAATMAETAAVDVSVNSSHSAPPAAVEAAVLVPASLATPLATASAPPADKYADKAGERTENGKIYQVRRRGTLSLIAKNQLGTATDWRRIFELNKNRPQPRPEADQSRKNSPRWTLRLPEPEKSKSHPSQHAKRPVAKHAAPATSNKTSATHVPAVWKSIAACESGGNWHINAANGYYGGLQFTASTWRSFSGHHYAPRADLATPAQQIEIAQRVQAAQGWNAWPTCSRRVKQGARA